MTIRDIEMFRTKFNVGDIVIVDNELAELTHEQKGSQIAEVVGKYRRFFNVKYDQGFQQSILYQDGGKVHKFLSQAV